MTSKSLCGWPGVALVRTTALFSICLIEDNHGGRLGGGLFVGAPPGSEQNHLDGGDLVIGSSLARIRRNVIRGNTLRYDTPHGVGMNLSMNAEVVGNIITGNVGHGVPGGGTRWEAG